MIILNNRTLIYISGSEQKSFLQGLITNDVNNINEEGAVYALMLNPQGRFLYDFFIIQFQDKLLLDCNKEKADEIIRKLSLYKLRADVEIGKMEGEWQIGVILNEKNDAVIKDIQDIKTIQKDKKNQLICFSDPRNKEMGLRIIAPKAALSKLSSENINLYNAQRFNLKIADDTDLEFNQSLILEYGLDKSNAVDYQKGCYVGQEVTARTHYRGLIRKALFVVEIVNSQAIEKGSEITCDNKKIGIILSSFFHNQKLQALALIKNIDNQGQKIDFSNASLQADNKVILIK